MGMTDPSNPNYLGRAEPVQLAAGQTLQGIDIGYPIAALSIDNFTEYFLFIESANRPGFWISPYETKTIVNLTPPANYINVNAMLHGPNGTSGAISSGGTGTVNIQLWDTPQASQAGIITSPPAAYVNRRFAQTDDGLTHNLFTVATGLTMNITRLKVAESVVENSGTDVLLSDMEVLWTGDNFSWRQTISPEHPVDSDDFDVGTAIVVAPNLLRAKVNTDLIGYYTAGGPTVELEILYYAVIH